MLRSMSNTMDLINDVFNDYETYNKDTTIKILGTLMQLQESEEEMAFQNNELKKIVSDNAINLKNEDEVLKNKVSEVSFSLKALSRERDAQSLKTLIQTLEVHLGRLEASEKKSNQIVQEKSGKSNSI